MDKNLILLLFMALLRCGRCQNPTAPPSAGSHCPVPVTAPSLISPGASLTIPAAPGAFPRVPFWCSSGSECEFPFPGTQAFPPARAGVQDLLWWLLRDLGSCSSPGCSVAGSSWGTVQTSAGISGICGHFYNLHKFPGGMEGWMDSAL